MQSDPESLTPTERAVLVTARLCAGQAVTVRALAHELEITPMAAYRTLWAISRVLPVASEAGEWRIVRIGPNGYR